VSDFWDQVDRSGDCWTWQGNRMAKGYGYLRVDGRTVLAHRMAYVLVHGAIPNGLQIDHVCHSTDKSCPGGICPHRACVNPAHLEAVTSLENTSRGRKKDSALDECKHHHKMTPDNTRYDKRDGARVCQTCNREKVARFRARQRGM